MPRILQPLLLLIADLTDRQLASTVQFLKVENEILRSKLPARISLTRQEKTRLLRFGKPLGAAIKQVISIVKPETFLKWIRQEKATLPKPQRSRPGRPCKPEELRELVLRIAHETDFGLGKIMGELKKLGITSISRSTVRNILLEEGLEPGPERGDKTWAEFIRIHATMSMAIPDNRKNTSRFLGSRMGQLLSCPSPSSRTRQQHSVSCQFA